MGRRARERDSDHRRYTHQDHHHSKPARYRHNSPDDREDPERNSHDHRSGSRKERDHKKSSRKNDRVEEMTGERGTGLPRGVEADHPHHPVKALIPPFGVGEARMRGMLNQVGNQLTKSKRYELRKEAEVYNTLRRDDQ